MRQKWFLLLVMVFCFHCGSPKRKPSHPTPSTLPSAPSTLPPAPSTKPSHSDIGLTRPLAKKETPETNPEDKEIPTGICKKLDVSQKQISKWLVPKLEAFLKSDAESYHGDDVRAMGNDARALLRAAEAGTPFPSDVYVETAGINTAVGIASLNEKEPGIPEHVPLAEQNIPVQVSSGCWGLIVTGVKSVYANGSDLSIDFEYTVAFVSNEGKISHYSVDAYWKGIDAMNGLYLADLDGDGWHEGFYLAENGWVGQDHDWVGGSFAILLTSKNGDLEPVAPFDDFSFQEAHWSLDDVNRDGRMDLTHQMGWDRKNGCFEDYDHWNDPPYVRNEFALMQDSKGQFSYANAESKIVLEKRCPTNPSRLENSENVICARIWGECTSDLKRRIRKTNKPWSCRRAKNKRKQLSADANREFHDMLYNAASFIPPASLRPVCKK